MQEFEIILKYGTDVLVLLLLYMLNEMKKDIRDIKDGITWGDTCNVKHAEIDRRLAALEKKAGINGSST